MPKGKQVMTYWCYRCEEKRGCTRVENKLHNDHWCDTCDDTDRCCETSINLKNYTHQCGGKNGTPQLATITL